MSGAPPGITISITEVQGFQALGQFLQAVCAPYPITIVRALGSTAPGSNVRVPEPSTSDFVVMSSLRRQRLETNETVFSDNICVGSIVGTTLTVASIARGVLSPNALVIDLGYPNGNILPNTVIVSQLTSTAPGGALGSTGTYRVSVGQTLASETLYAGTRADAVANMWDVQLDVHGPNSLQNVNTIDTLFRSEYGANFFTDTGLWVAPLYIDDAQQIPFENAEAEIEFRWVMTAHLSVTPIVTTPQQFMDNVVVDTVEAGVIYVAS